MAGEYVVTTILPGPAVVNMAPFGQAMCYFTRLAGDFDDAADSVQIQVVQGQNGTSTWQLSALSPVGHKLQGRARCLAFDQT